MATVRPCCTPGSPICSISGIRSCRPPWRCTAEGGSPPPCPRPAASEPSGGITTSGSGWITEQIELIRAGTDAAFGVGFITSFLDFAGPLLDTALPARPPVLVLSFGDPTEAIPAARDAGCRVVCQVQTPNEATVAVDAGADVLIAQGNEAGRHTGHMALLALLSTIRDLHPDTPLLAAGGIADGAGLAAVLTAGADGALVGTAFLATHEVVEVHQRMKEAIVSSDGTDTVFTTSWDTLGGLPWPEGIGERVLANRFTDEWHGRDTEIEERRAELGERFDYGPTEPDPATDHLPFGSSAGLVRRVRPAAEVLEEMSADAERILRTRPRDLLR